MEQGRKLISSALIWFLIVSFTLPVNATNIQDAKDKEHNLKNQKAQAEAEKESLTARLRQLSDSMEQAAANLEKKNEEIEAAEQELVTALIEEETQYESMKLRIQYMYEEGNANLIEVFIEAESFSDFINKAEYAIMLSDYDRNRLDDFKKAVKEVEEKEQILQKEYEELTALQDSLIEQKAEAQELLAQKSSELDNIEKELNEIRKQIAKAEEAEKKKQEAAEAEKNQQASKPNTGGTSSSGEQVSSKPPVVSGSGYFTHPCPGMSYQSSYFGEIRDGIGDTRPHKGHDYAAPAGTPIYAAASGTVTLAGYSRSAGYWVVINHGNGLVSKYMHMYAMPLVRTGQKVAKGQHIGGVGTTGQSTGNHLHFQVELNGVPVNPSNYM